MIAEHIEDVDAAGLCKELDEAYRLADIVRRHPYPENEDQRKIDMDRLSGLIQSCLVYLQVRFGLSSNS